MLHFRLLRSGPDRREAAPRPGQICAGLVLASEVLLQLRSLPASDAERILRLHPGERRNGLVITLKPYCPKTRPTVTPPDTPRAVSRAGIRCRDRLGGLLR